MTSSGASLNSPQTKDEKHGTESEHLLGNKQKDDTETRSHADDHTFLETIAESAEVFAENVQEFATEFKGAVVEEAHEIQEAFLDELTERDDNDAIFFEMGLTRNLSILPSDLQDAAAQQKKEAGEAEEDEEAKPILPLTGKEEETHVPFHAYITLLLAVVALSSLGPSLAMQQEVASVMKIFWRQTGTWMFLLPFASRDIFKLGFPSMDKSQWFTFILAAFSYAIMGVCFVVALEYTSVGNAVIFANSQAVLLLAGKLLIGSRVLWMEAVGAIVAFLGAILCCTDGSASTSGPIEKGKELPLWSVWGDLLALVAGLGGCFYLVFSKMVRSNFPSVYVFVFFNMFTASCCVLLYMLLSNGKIQFSRNIHIGMYGFLNTRYDRLPLELFMIVVCNLTGSMGYVRSMQYFDNMIISVATLMEPVVASILAYFIHVGLLPGALGWFGNLLVAAGTICVILPGTKKGGSAGH